MTAQRVREPIAERIEQLIALASGPVSKQELVAAIKSLRGIRYQSLNEYDSPVVARVREVIARTTVTGKGVVLLNGEVLTPKRLARECKIADDQSGVCTVGRVIAGLGYRRLSVSRYQPVRYQAPSERWDE